MALAFQEKTINFKPAHKYKMGRFVFYGLYSILLFILNVSFTLAKEPEIKGNYTIIKNLNESWLVYDKTYNDYVPYLSNRHFNYHSFNQNFEIENFKGYNLEIFTPNEAYLFINGKYQTKLVANSWKDITIDSLSRINNNSSNILISIYLEKSDLEGIEMFVIHKTKQKIEGFSENSLKTALKARKFSDFNDFSILFSILLLSLITFIYNFQDKLLVKYLDLKDLFTISKRTDSIIVNRPFDIGNILFMILLSMTMALIIMILENNFVQILPQSFSKSENNTLLTLTGQFLNLGFLIFIMFMVKYFFITIISNLYQLDKIKNIHFFKNLQASGAFSFLLLVLLAIFSIYQIGAIEYNKIFYLILISSFYLIRLLLLFFIILKSNPIKNLYLFSYLCIVELIPLFIGIRLAL